jgi:hypothetical protein
MQSRRAAEVHRARGVQSLRVHRRHPPTGRAEQHESAPDCQAGKAGVEGGLAHAVLDGGNARAAGELSDARPELLWVVGVVEHFHRAACRDSCALCAVEVVVMTRAPRLVAHWVRIRPAPPAPACTSTVSPFLTGKTELISRWAVMPLGIAAAATAGLTPSGNEATTLAGQRSIRRMRRPRRQWQRGRPPGGPSPRHPSWLLLLWPVDSTAAGAPVSRAGSDYADRRCGVSRSDTASTPSRTVFASLRIWNA